jgi:hypothetical protein
MSGQLDPIQLMRKIAELEDKINALRTIEVGGVWADWTPSYSAAGAMTYTSVTTDEARYCVVGNLLHYKIRANGTTGGTANPEIYFTSPLNRIDTVAYGGAAAAFLYDNGDKAGIVTFFGNSQNTIRVSKYDGSNWGLGETKVFIVSGFFEI